MGVQMRMYAVHSEYEEESSAHLPLATRSAATEKGGLGKFWKKYLFMWHLELFELIKKKSIIGNVW